MEHFTPLTDIKSVLTILSRISFLGGVADAQRDKIFHLLETGHFNQGDYISKKGEQPSHIYIIRQGKVRLELADESVTVNKREFGVGDCFGEAALIAMNNNTASFVAAEDCEIIMLSRRALNQLHHDDLELFSLLIVNIARELARKLQYTDEILLHQKHEPGA